MSTATIPSRAVVVLPCSADPEAWYDPDQETTAKAACASCPARDNCLTLAISTDEPWGVWGGYTEPERQRLTKGRQPVVCPTCRQQCVPDRPTGRRCDRCSGARHGRTVDDDREQIAQLAADGLTDRKIAERLGWPVTKVKQCRVRYQIPSMYPNGGGRHALADNNVKPCGTYAAYRRHKRRGEPVDEACKAAERRRYHEWKANQKTEPRRKKATAVK